MPGPDAHLRAYFCPNCGYVANISRRTQHTQGPAGICYYCGFGMLRAVFGMMTFGMPPFDGLVEAIRNRAGRVVWEWVTDWNGDIVRRP